MNYFLNLALLIAAYQSINAENPWYERLAGAATNFFVFHAGLTWIFSRQSSPDGVDNFFMTVFSYIKIFDSLLEIIPLLMGSSLMYLLTFAIRKLRK